MKQVLRRKTTRQAAVPLDGVPTIEGELYLRFSLGDDPDSGELESDAVAAAAVEIRRRQMAKLQKDPNFALPDEMPRYA